MSALAFVRGHPPGENRDQDYRFHTAHVGIFILDTARKCAVSMWFAGREILAM